MTPSWQLSKTAGGWWGRIPFPESVTTPSQVMSTQKNFLCYEVHHLTGDGSQIYWFIIPMSPSTVSWVVRNYTDSSPVAWWWFLKRVYNPWPALSNSSTWSNTSSVFPSHWFNSSEPQALGSVSSVRVSSIQSAMSSSRIHWAVVLCFTVAEAPLVSEVPFIFYH